jgi:hypothetical protein
MDTPVKNGYVKMLIKDGKRRYGGMNNEQFVKDTEEFFKQCIEIMNKKGAEYSGSEDKFANFKRLAAKYGVPIEEIWGIYFSKHIDSIDSFVRKRRKGYGISFIESNLSEPITGRIMDAINYLAILKGIIDESRERELEPQLPENQND